MNVYEIITGRICERLEAGVVPWRKPWTTRGLDGMPRNLVTRRPYRGVNVWMLAMMGYGSPDWLTYRQAAGLGGHVRQGEKATPVIFWKRLDAPALPDDDTDAPEPADTRDARRAPMLRYYWVFNVEQCDGLPVKPAVVRPPAPDPIDAAEGIVAGMPHRPEIRHAGGAAFYTPARDVVTLPPRGAFPAAAEFYSTLFHELTHSTGHASRLNRAGAAEAAPFGSPVYSREELVAELGAAFVPPPRRPLLAYHGLLAPRAAWRAAVVPKPSPAGARVPADGPAPRRWPWARLLQRVFGFEVLVCDRCGGPRRILGAVTEPDAVRRVLVALGLAAEPPPDHAVPAA